MSYAIQLDLVSRFHSRVFVIRHLLISACLIIVLASTVQAIPLAEYHAQVRRAVTALDTLVQIDEDEDAGAYDTRSGETIQGVRTLLPRTQTVEWSGLSQTVDNSWLYDELDAYGAAASEERPVLLRRTTQRLQAIAEQIAELERGGTRQPGNKADQNRKLTEILQRPEYVTKAKGKSAMARYLDRFLKWFQNLFPKPKPLSPGRAGIFSQIAQVLVILLALGVVAYVLKLFLPRLVRGRRAAKKQKRQARIVLGEKLEPDQSAIDLLSEAETLARQGELRAAIRKAYIALLVELGERKTISLAQHKTNRDYLSSVRDLQPLYGDVKRLTDSFERHWYGLAQPTETEWIAFRSAYTQALQK